MFVGCCLLVGWLLFVAWCVVLCAWCLVLGGRWSVVGGWWFALWLPVVAWRLVIDGWLVGGWCLVVVVCRWLLVVDCLLLVVGC